jgi:hypothetical protein
MLGEIARLEKGANSRMRGRWVLKDEFKWSLGESGSLVVTIDAFSWSMVWRHPQSECISDGVRRAILHWPLISSLCW